MSTTKYPAVALDYFVVAMGGAFGATSRHFLLSPLPSAPCTFPFPTLAINVVGSFLLGVLLGGGLSHRWRLFAATGLLGSFTTFSTLAFEIVQLSTSAAHGSAAAYAAATLVLGISAAHLGGAGARRWLS